MDSVEPCADPSGFSPRSLAVACIMIARFLQAQHPEFATYLNKALASAVTAGLSNADLDFVRLVVKSISG